MQWNNSSTGTLIKVLSNENTKTENFVGQAVTYENLAYTLQFAYGNKHGPKTTKVHGSIYGFN